MTTKYLDAVTKLHSSGYPHLASAAIAHYERLASGMSAEHRCRVSEMFDEVLETALNRREEITSEDILLSPDFVAIRALARVLQDLKLVEPVLEMTELDVLHGQFVEEVKPPPPPIDIVFDDLEILSEGDEPLANLVPQKTQRQYRIDPPVLYPTPGKKPSHRLP
jgi:hypothetical protein